MDKKSIKILIMGFLLVNTAVAHAQFYTLRNTQRKYVVVKDTTKRSKELIQSQDQQMEQVYRQDTIHNNAEQKQGKSFFKKIFSLPTKKLKVNSKYGFRNDPFSSKKKFHAGVDIAASKQEVCSIMPGTIKEIGFDKKGLGNYVKVSFSDFLITYAHLKTSIGSEGDVIKAGDVIGISGSTGRSTGDHLHISVKFKGKYIDPLPILQFIQEDETKIERL
jgi:murein DD-endopeptidase MepM/ murein hydrolase activator NlpD